MKDKKLVLFDKTIVPLYWTLFCKSCRDARFVPQLESASTESVISSPSLYANPKKTVHYCSPGSSTRSHGKRLKVTDLAQGDLVKLSFLQSSILS